MQDNFEALGTKWWITLYEEPKAADSILTDIRRFVHEYEASYSRFKADSVISILNRERVLTNPTAECCELLQFGKQLYLRTNTTFNILTGHILEARGYDADYSFTDHNSATLTPGNPITDLDISTEKVTLRHGNIDLGGYGKGYLIDLLAQRLQQNHGVNYFLINGGGDMFATSNHDEPVDIFLAHPTQPTKIIGKTTLYNEAFAGSSPHLRSWTTPTGNTNHIIGDVMSDNIYLKAKTASDADAFATTFLQQTPSQIQQLAVANNLTLIRTATS